MSYADPAKAPRDGKVIQEGSGVITSDSLAAESYNAGGGFESAPQSVPSKSTTANTTDTSGASILPPSQDRASRVDPGASDDTYSTPADASYTNTADGTNAPYDTRKGYVDSSSIGTAPTYVDAVQQANSGAMPKGEGLKEGGFDSDAPNASFNADIGGRNDPGRAAEESFARSNAKNAADAGYEDDTNIQGGKGGFENLNAEEQA